MIASSAASDSPDSLFFEATSSASQGKGSQSPVRYGDPNEGYGFGSFVASTPERNMNRY